MFKIRLLTKAHYRSQIRAIHAASIGLENQQSTVFVGRPRAPLLCQQNTLLLSRKKFSTAKSEQGDSITQDSPLDSVTFERVCSETLDSLCDQFEELLENANNLNGTDVAYSDGVLTVNFGSNFGTYVINRQTPNKQIWLSSPTSGPKRYDFVGPKTAESGQWIYKHNNESMHELLQREIKQILKDQNFDFLTLPYAK